jgi:mannose-6-phosphate isomerase-like protein (cupin superfamily)
MADYTKKNLKTDVEDSAPKFGMAPDMQAHFAGGDLELTTSGAAYEFRAPNTRTPFGHRHRDQEELYVVVEGSGRIKLDDDVVELSEFDAVRISPGVMRNVEAGPDGIGIICFGAPKIAGDPQEEVEMVPGWWD